MGFFACRLHKTPGDIKGTFHIWTSHSLVSLVSLQKEENVVFSWVDFSYSVQLHKIHLAPAEYHTTINCCLFNNVKLAHACWHTYPDYSVHYTHEEIIGREKFRKNATWEWSLCICWLLPQTENSSLGAVSPAKAKDPSPLVTKVTWLVCCFSLCVLSNTQWRHELVDEIFIASMLYVMKFDTDTPWLKR